MSKAILIMDMPEHCGYCNFCYYSDGRVPTCQLKLQAIENYKEKPAWCPLKPLPEKYDIEAEKKKPHDRDYDWEFEGGYNTCIDQIIGMEEAR